MPTPVSAKLPADGGRSPTKYPCGGNSRHYPAVGWIRGSNVDSSNDMEFKIGEYMKKHVISLDDIDNLFSVNEETLVLGGDNTDPDNLKKSNSQ